MPVLKETLMLPIVTNNPLAKTVHGTPLWLTMRGPWHGRDTGDVRVVTRARGCVR
jgi:hypothetical protein